MLRVYLCVDLGAFGITDTQILNMDGVLKVGAVTEEAPSETVLLEGASGWPEPEGWEKSWMTILMTLMEMISEKEG